MTAQEIAQIVALSEQLFPLTVQLINSLRAAGVPTKTVEELLAQANANDDAIIATANKELHPPTP